MTPQWRPGREVSRRYVSARQSDDRSGGQVLEFDGLHKSFGDNRVLDGVGFTVAPGSMFGFCGSNGAGKTTTMRIAMGLVRADAGEVRWRGRPLDEEARRRVGYMPEERGLYPKMKVGEQVAYFARLHGMDRAAATRSAQEWVERLGLGERRGDPVEKLSLGNQQRVQLAAALVSRPEVLILDEPFSGLDPVGVDSLAEALFEQRRSGVPVVFSSHQLDLVERLCDSVGILARGSMVATGTVEELRRREAGRLLRVVVPDAPPAWAAVLPGVRVVSERAGDTLLELDECADDQAVLAAALRTGRVTHFAWRQPSLVELFREVVAVPSGVAAVAA
jgi:ABC-2 type transport system ATP-binding protein